MTRKVERKNGFLNKFFLTNLFTLIFFANFPQYSFSQPSGPLVVHPGNGRYFADGSGKIVYLTGSHTWSNFQDNGNGNPPPVFDWIGYIEWMKSLNHNFMRLWSWEQTRWSSETADYDYWYYPQTPYKRTGPGTALDGQLKFNLDSLDDAYFQRIRTRVIEAGERGIYVSIMLFDGWSVSNRLGFRQPFDGCPMRLSNNINGVNGDADGDGDGEETHSLLDPVVNQYQYTYVKRVIDAVNDLDNVLYEISNESPYEGSDAWQKRMVDTIHAYELRKPKQHPVGYTGDWGIENSDLWSSNADWISPGAGDNGSQYQDNPPAGDGSKVVITDSDHLWGVGGDRVWVWKSFLRGLNPIFMDGYDGKSYGNGGVNFDSSNATWISFRKNMGYTRSFATRMNLASMIPQNSLSSTTYCLANASGTGAEYLVYDPSSSGSIVVNLSATTGNLNVEWFNPETGLSTFSGSIAGGSTRTFSPPFSGDAVLYLSSMGNGPIPTGTFQNTVPSLPAGGGTVTLNWTSVGATYVDIDQGIGTVPFNGSVNVNVTTTTTFSLRLINSNGTTILTTTVNVASPPALQINTIYSENALTSPWRDVRSWSVTRSYTNTSNVYQGTTAARIVHSPWGSLQFSNGTWGTFVLVDPTLYQSFDFVIKGGSSPFTMKVSCLEADGSSLLTPVSFSVPANSWLVKSIPMNQLATDPFISIQFTADGSNVTFYLDNISLILKPTGPTIPVIPNLLSPANNSLNQPTSVGFIWNSSPSAVSYQLQVSLDSLFSTTVFNDSTITDTTRILSGLINGSNYFWRVLAQNAVGKSNFSTTRKFSTIVELPNVPQLCSPLNISIDQTIPITFLWNKAQRATGYRLQVALDSNFSTIVFVDSTLIDTTRIVPNFQSLTKYFWRVSSKNIAGYSPFSSSWTYTTAIAPPSIPVLSTPADNALNQSLNIQCSWLRVPGADSYRLQVSTDSAFSNVFIDESSITDSVYSLSLLSNSTKYFWRVNASNTTGSSSFSLVRRFTTIAPAPLPPILVSPTNGSSSQTITLTFVWNKSINASSYRLQLSIDSLFSTIVVDDSTLTDTNRVITTLSYATNYFWRVRAVGAGGTSSYSSLFNFATGTIPVIPTLLSPSNNAINLPTSVIVRWNSTQNTTSYHIQISTDSMFTSFIVNDSTMVDTSKTVASLNSGISYYWRASARNTIGKSPFSSFWKFTTVPPAAPTVNYIYQDGILSAPWNDIRSWSVSRNYASTAPVFQGSSSARIVHSPWAALQFSQGTWGSFININPTVYQSLDFAVHGGTTGVTLRVSCLRPSGGNVFTPVVITVPANTWQTKSIAMIQLANVPFLSVYFTALGSNVTFSLDNVGLVYQQGSPLAAKTLPGDKIVKADFSSIGKIDGQSIAYFVDAWKRNDLSIADIGPAVGTVPNIVLQKDGRIDFNDYVVFHSFWKWSQREVVKNSVDEKASDTKKNIEITSPPAVSSLRHQTFKIQLIALDEAQTVEMTLHYDPLKTTIEDIAADSANGLLWFTNIDNTSGIATAVIASTDGHLSNEQLTADLFKITMSRSSASGDDSIQVMVRSFSESTDMMTNTTRSFKLQSLFIPKEYELSQNFPNPFNPSTTIRYSLPVKSRVRLEVFNSIGQLVSRLVDKELEAGYGDVVWKSGTASGIYFYRMAAVSSENPSKRFTNVKKMIILK